MSDDPLEAMYALAGEQRDGTLTVPAVVAFVRKMRWAMQADRGGRVHVRSAGEHPRLVGGLESWLNLKRNRAAALAAIYAGAG